MKQQEAMIDYWRIELQKLPENPDARGWFQDAWASVVEYEINTAAYSTPNIGPHITRYQELIDNNTPMILVGMSLGSLYSKIGYEWMDNSFPDDNLEIVGVMNIGSFTSNIPGNRFNLGDYLTFNEDEAVNKARVIPGLSILPGNLDYISPKADVNMNHFAYVYLSETTPAQVLWTKVNNIDSVLSQNIQLCQPDPDPDQEPVSCGSNISGRQGSSEGFTPPPVNLGSEAGPVQVAFEAYTIPDGYEVKRSIDNQELLSTDGLVSGYHLDSFNHNPDPENPATFLVDLEVTGNSDTDTLWNITLGCPGDAVPDNRVTVDFDVSGVGGNSCSASLYIDDVYQQVVYPNSADFSLQLSAGSNGAGFHTASLQNISTGCQVGTISSYFSISIRQNGNSKGSFGVPAAPNTTFFVD